jgi:GNAT superfamily N-acetyltransferase
VYIGGHSVAGAGWDYSNGGVLFANSWGRRWGDDGHGEISVEYFDRYVFDIWLSRNARYGWTTEKSRRYKEPLSQRDLVSLWMTEAPRWKHDFNHNGKRHTLVFYESLSATGGPTEIIDIRNGFGLRLGWAHLHHLPVKGEEPATSVLKEFFIWPSFRRQGYGTLLEEMASYKARMWRSQKIQIFFHDIDSFPHVRAAGRLFAIKQGYNWRM